MKGFGKRGNPWGKKKNSRFSNGHDRHFEGSINKTKPIKKLKVTGRA